MAHCVPEKSWDFISQLWESARSFKQVALTFLPRLKAHTQQRLNKY